jgi:cob(I)alamin adenosyltransferase
LAERGLLIVYTGHGKGKTTASLGLAMRAVGQGLKVMMVQFIKGSWKYGELETVRRLAPDFQILPMGKGFTWEEKPAGEDERAGEAALAKAREVIHSGRFDLVILDEINNAIQLGLVELEQVLSLVKEKPEKLHLVLTGRDAKKEIIELADLVTEMREIKHPFQKGILAVRGIEY